MNKENFYYLLYETNESDLRKNKKIFDEGITFVGKNIESNAKLIDSIDIENENYDPKIICNNSKSNTVFLIKIPKDYLGKSKEENGSYLPVPLLKIDWEDENNKNIKFINYLIEGIYNKDDDTFTKNPNFSLVFNPEGLVFANDQINNFRDLNKNTWVSYANERAKFTYEQLVKADEATKTWNIVVDKYMQEYCQDSTDYVNAKVR